MDDIVKIQATISGYSGNPCSVLSAFYRETGILAVVKIHAYSEQPIKGASVITNVPRIDRDSWFDEKDLKDAIRSFKSMFGRVSQDGSRGLELSPTVQRANPNLILDRNGIDVSGEKFKIAPDVTNEHIAVLATCLYVDRLETTELGIGIIDGVNDAYRQLVMGWSVTI